MLRKSLLLILFLFFGSVSQAQAGLRKPLVVVNSNWLPYKGEYLPNGGVVTDITKQVLLRAGYDVTLNHAPWKRAVIGAYNGTYDVVPAVWWTQERGEKLAFTTAILNSRIVIISKKHDAFEYKTLEDLHKKMVAVSSGWGYPKEFMEADFIKKDTSVNLDSSLKKLMHGRLNYVIGEEIAARHAATKLFKEEAEHLKYSKISLKENLLHVAFSKKMPDYKDVTLNFNKAFEEMRADGSLEKILKAHGIKGVKVPNLQ